MGRWRRYPVSAGVDTASALPGIPDRRYGGRHHGRPVDAAQRLDWLCAAVDVAAGSQPGHRWRKHTTGYGGTAAGLHRGVVLDVAVQLRHLREWRPQPHADCRIGPRSRGIADQARRRDLQHLRWIHLVRCRRQNCDVQRTIPKIVQLRRRSLRAGDVVRAGVPGRRVAARCCRYRLRQGRLGAAPRCAASQRARFERH